MLLGISILLHRSNASAAIKQFTFTWRNVTDHHSRCSQWETSLRIRRGLLGGGPRLSILSSTLLRQPHTVLRS